MRKRTLKSVFYLFVILLTLTSTFRSYAAYPGEVGSSAPSFVLRDLDGKLFSFSRYCGENVPEEQRKVFILTFFATWCEPCKEEVPIMKKILQEWRDRGVEILYIGFRQGNEKLSPFAKEYNLAMTILGDKYGVTAKNYGVNSLPRTIIVDRDCVIQSHIRGALENLEEVLTSKLSEILSPPSSAEKPEPVLAEKRLTPSAKVSVHGYIPPEISLPAYTGKKSYIAVLSLEAKGDAGKEIATVLSDSLRRALVDTNRFSVVERANMDAILKEQGFSLQDCTSSECIVKVGKLLSAEKIVTGSIGKLGQTYSVEIRLTNVETGQIEKTATERCPCAEDDLFKAIDYVAKRLVVK